MSSCSIGHRSFYLSFEKNKNYVGLTTEIFTRLDKDKDFSAVTSIITLLELLVMPVKQGRYDLADEYVHKLLGDEKLITWVVNGEIAVKAAKLRAEYRIKTPDAIQLATAILAHADLFITNDTNLKKVKEINIEVLNEFL